MFKGVLEGDLEETTNRNSNGTCCQARVDVRSRAGLIKVWFSFNYLELDSEVGRLIFVINVLILIMCVANLILLDLD